MSLLRLAFAAITRRRNLFLLAILLLISAVTRGQIIPLPVGPAGIGPLRFDTQPTPADGWSQRNVCCGNNAIQTRTEMDVSVQTNEVAGITNELVIDRSSSGPYGSSSSNFSWNSPHQFIESHPGNIAYLELLLSLRNNSGGDRNLVILEYDFGIVLLPGTTVSEDPGLYGYRVYYSFTGAPGTWVHIPELDSPEGGGDAGSKRVLINFAVPWENGGNLYILWIDDNAVTGQLTGPVVDGAYTIDNLSISFEDTATITTQPHDVIVEQCRSTNLTVAATGAAFSYQWFKDGDPISGATSLTLPINNAQRLANDGMYFVKVSGFGSVDSSAVTVTVIDDTNAPVVVSALAEVDGTNFLVTYSEIMDFQTATQPAAYHLHSISGDGIDVEPSSVMLSPDGKTLTLRFDEPRAQYSTYQLFIDRTVVDNCVKLPLAGPLNEADQVVVALKYEIYLMTFENTPWKCNHEGLDLGTAWRLNPAYDDSGWSNGVSIFDGKIDLTTGASTPRSSINGMGVMTQLPLRFGTFVNSNVPCYYFRTHFSLPTSPSEINGLQLRTLVDDFDVAYMNNYEVPVRVNSDNPLSDLNTYGYSGGTAVGTAGVLGTFSINPSNLVSCNNLICVKLFQQAGASSDITFAYELIAVINNFAVEVPSLIISSSANMIAIRWCDLSAMLFEASSVDPATNAWTPVVGAAPGYYSFAIGAGAAQKFYSLRR